MLEKQTPKIRFKGFTDDWEQRKLGNLCSEIGDGLHSAPTYDEDGQYYFINGNNLVNGKIAVDAEETKKVSEKVFSENNSHLDNQTILMSINGTIGNLAYYQGERVMLGKSAAYLKCKDINKEFLFSLLQTADALEQFELSLTGTTIKNLGLESIKRTAVLVPKVDEQKRIGKCFSSLDRLITLHQRKYEKLRIIKKSMLENCFPRNGEKVPKIRFSGFTGDWEQRKLGDVAQITMGQSPDGSTYSEEPSDYILVQGNADLQNGWVTPRVWTTQKTKTANAGDLIMSVRAPAGAMGKTAYDAVIGRGVAAIKGNEFIYQNLVKMDSDGYWKKLAAGSTYESINSDTVFNAEIMLPSEPEQEKIGAYFKSLDHLITLHQRKLETLKQIKKSLLEQMFV